MHMHRRYVQHQQPRVCQEHFNRHLVGNAGLRLYHGVDDGLVEPFMFVLSKPCQTVTLLFL
jgi:hypothetical protein